MNVNEYISNVIKPRIFELIKNPIKVDALIDEYIRLINEKKTEVGTYLTAVETEIANLNLKQNLNETEFKKLDDTLKSLKSGYIKKIGINNEHTQIPTIEYVDSNYDKDKYKKLNNQKTQIKEYKENLEDRTKITTFVKSLINRDYQTANTKYDEITKNQTSLVELFKSIVKKYVDSCELNCYGIENPDSFKSYLADDYIINLRKRHPPRWVSVEWLNEQKNKKEELRTEIINDAIGSLISHILLLLLLYKFTKLIII
jgi:hypothetical protein